MTADGVAATAAVIALLLSALALVVSIRGTNAAEVSAGAATESATAATTSAAAAQESATAANRSADAGERAADATELQVHTSRAQLDEARRTREQQVRPYVAVLVEQDPNNRQHIYFVVRNFGQSPARDVKFDLDPPAWHSEDAAGRPAGPLELPTELWFLPPGGEFRTFWDSGLHRADSDLPDRHTVNLTYRSDEFGTHTEQHVLDLSFLPFTTWARN